MTRDEAKSILFDMLGNTTIIEPTEQNQAILTAIKALEQEPCEDAISRQAALDMMQMRMGGKELYMAVHDLSPVTPQPDTARIIVGKSRGGMTLWYQCEKCNEPIDNQDTFCRGCGRRLVK